MGSTLRRTKRWAAVAAIGLGLAGPLAAQTPAWNASPPRSTTPWPDVAGPTLPPTGGPIDGPLLAPGEPLPERPETAPPAPVKIPQKVWMEAPGSRPMSPPGLTMPASMQDRPIRDTGLNWKYSVYPKPPTGPSGGSPAAALAVPPGGVVQSRPNWGWHGYGEYNVHGHAAQAEVGTQPVSNSNLAAEMAPYMKYAHLWHLTHNGVSAAPGGNLAVGPHEPALPNLNPTPIPRPVNPGWNTSDSSADAGEPTIRRANFTPEPITPQEPALVAAGPKLPLAVRERISELCAGKAQNLVVEQTGPTRLRLGMAVRTHSDAEWLTFQLSALPELRPYKVDFEVQISP